MTRKYKRSKSGLWGGEGGENEDLNWRRGGSSKIRGVAGKHRLQTGQERTCKSGVLDRGGRESFVTANTLCVLAFLLIHLLWFRYIITLLKADCVYYMVKKMSAFRYTSVKTLICFPTIALFLLKLGYTEKISKVF